MNKFGADPLLDMDFEDLEGDWINKPRVRAKVCLVGDAGVGKTSLIQRFVLDQFDERYLKTIGTKVSKKSVCIFSDERDRNVEVIMTIWDIMGQEGFRELLKDAYFNGANGILAVCDVTSTESMNRLDGWLDRTYKVAGEVPIGILANKIDLLEDKTVDDHTLEQFSRAYACPYFYTSAKTGENVEKVFTDLAGRILQKEAPRRSPQLVETQ